MLPAILRQNPGDLVRRYPLGRRLTQALVQKTIEPFILVTLPIAPELPFRTAQKLTRLQRRQIPPQGHPGIALAHELVHVLTNSGEHSSQPGNLMREETALENTQLTAEQCRQILEGGTARGLLAEPK